MEHEKFDVEGELRAHRSAPRTEFADTLAGDVRRTGPSRSRRLSVGSGLALTGLIVVAVASFGGIGYASSSPNAAKKQPAKVWVVKGPSSAAAAQYGTTSTTTTTEQAVSPTNTPAKPTGGTESAEGTLAAPKAKSAQLPFTGLSLWVPLAIGLMLISLGLVLRTRGRRRDAAQ
jgi:hypothetical protein